MAEGGGLLNRCRTKSSTGGSNPPLSATLFQDRFEAPLILQPQRPENAGLCAMERSPMQRDERPSKGLFQCSVRERAA